MIIIIIIVFAALAYDYFIRYSGRPEFSNRMILDALRLLVETGCQDFFVTITTYILVRFWSAE